MKSYGIAGDRLVAAGAGMMAPVASNDDEKGRAKNRRVVLVKANSENEKRAGIVLSSSALASATGTMAWFVRFEDRAGQLVWVDLDDLPDAGPANGRRNIDGRRYPPVGRQNEISDRLVFGRNLVVAGGTDLSPFPSVETEWERRK